MSKYVVKRLPVKGDIEVGDLLRSESFGRQVVRVTEIGDGVYWTDERDFHDDFGESYFGIRKEKAIKLGSLVLCSYDIQTGDKVICNGHEDIVVEYPFIDPDGHGYDIVLKEEGTQVLGYDTFKVIGEVSKDAIWVKEGMEIEEDDFVAYFCNTLGGHVKVVEDGDINKPGTNWKLYDVICVFKCSQCKTFH